MKIASSKQMMISIQGRLYVFNAFLFYILYGINAFGIFLFFEQFRISEIFGDPLDEFQE